MLAATGFQANALWYLMRATGVVSLVLLTAVFVLGIATFRRWRPARLPGFVTPALHRSLSLVAVAFLAVHVLTAVVDPYAMVGIVSVLVPFTAGWKPFWVGLGAVSLDLVAALVVSSLLRARIRAGTWRAIHWLAYASWPLALAHSLGSGTDATSVWMRGAAVACIAAVGGSLIWRLLQPLHPKHLEARPVRS
jgi:sulfoxide reductase heme-binding subunit YedZ